MKIIVKNSDRLVSTFHESKVMNEYLVYLMDEDVKISVDMIYGDDSKNELVDRLLGENFDQNGNYNLEDVIEEVAFEEFDKQYI